MADQTITDHISRCGVCQRGEKLETTHITARGARNHDPLAYKGEKLPEEADRRLGAAVVRALDARVGDAAVGLAFRDELRKLGFDIIPLLTDEAAERIWRGIQSEIAHG